VGGRGGDNSLPKVRAKEIPDETGLSHTKRASKASLVELVMKARKGRICT